jgi:RHH-type transcriptional regulator, rel operon repressor / antitoxin RelB
MPKTNVTHVRFDPDLKQRVKDMANVLGRSSSYVVETAVKSYLDQNEWQLKAIQEAIQEADSPHAEWIDHEALKAEWEAKREN